ncbi:hypothetical protein TD95_001883 [Thielaviopsis punctulata]|uniref:Uncharacterized protein n=1 Tax=Thielaviopsis punctulata TaxID=72032 RepID=A0A0F4ZEL7_9PEZI|nr:hypothetical protein TD95_001883 [Thielaviopsis punctulata]
MSSSEIRRKPTDDDAISAPEAKTSTEFKTTYRSWKKKYRKMKARFDQVSRESRELYTNEMHAVETIKRIAIENDRLLDTLLTLNKTPQLPAKRRVDISMPLNPDANKALTLQCDSTPEDHRLPCGTSLRDLERLVPGCDLASMKRADPALDEELQPMPGSKYPVAFLSIDDIDTYLYKLNKKLAIPCKDRAASAANSGSAHLTPSARDYTLNNPTSEYNWLRKHAPKTFLQDAVPNPTPLSLSSTSKEKDLPSRTAPATTPTSASAGLGAMARGRLPKRGPRGTESEHSDDEDAGSRPAKKRRVGAEEEGRPKAGVSGIKHVKKKAKRPSGGAGDEEE